MCRGGWRSPGRHRECDLPVTLRRRCGAGLNFTARPRAESRTRIYWKGTVFLVLRLGTRHWQWLAALSIIVVWVASLLPLLGIGKLGIAQSDKILHFVAYLVIAFLLARGWPLRPAWKTWLIALACGGLAELGQHLLTQVRQAELLDMVANGAGAFVGVLVSRLTDRILSGLRA